MLENNYKKILILGILILFIGAAIAPSISGFGRQDKIKSTRESATGFPLENDDFINAYWKFDECSGNTVEDSSGHDYDGTRYGATWITNGYSGCALDFDGVNDYVELSPYSNKIGINKTDDFIIEFYIKTSSSNPGIIFSATGYKNIPEFRIELHNNGSLQFKVWTALCGITLYTSEGLNNGAWHEIQIYFNGITTDPTVDIFVDDNLDNSITDWLCEIESNDFLDATIGKRASDDTGFFDGIIDEFKFIKYPGGNEQVPPDVSGPENGEQGAELEYTFVTNDPEEDDIEIKIDWGDEEITDWDGPYESGEEVKVTHTYNEEGTYYIKTRSQDRWHHSRWSQEGYEVKIGNQAPEKPIISGPKYGDPDVAHTYEFIADDFENNQIKYLIDWDDGDTIETDYYPANTTVQLTHSYQNEGDYFITAQAIDEHGKAGPISDEYWIRIGDEPPRKPDIDGPINGKPGTEINFDFTAIDPENDKVRFNIKWGDGEEITETDEYDSGESVRISHIWENSGNYIVEARAKDQFDYWSTWERYEITIPRSKGISNNFIELLFERFPDFFHLLKFVLGL
jgi:hypothetical protein